MNWLVLLGAIVFLVATTIAVAVRQHARRSQARFRPLGTRRRRPAPELRDQRQHAFRTVRRRPTRSRNGRISGSTTVNQNGTCLLTGQANDRCTCQRHTEGAS